MALELFVGYVLIANSFELNYPVQGLYIAKAYLVFLCLLLPPLRFLFYFAIKEQKDVGKLKNIVNEYRNRNSIYVFLTIAVDVVIFVGLAANQNWFYSIPYGIVALLSHSSLRETIEMAEKKIKGEITDE